MPETTFALAYDGPALADGRMEVRDLAPALLSLADLFRQANAVTFPEAPPVTLEIRAQDRGSFVVDLALVQPEFVDEAIRWLTSQQVTALLHLRELVIGGGAVVGGVFWLIKKARGRRITDRDSSDAGMVRIHFSDGEMLEVPWDVLTLYDKVTIRRRAREVVEPVRREGIEAVRFYREEDREVTFEATSDDVDAFEVVEQEERLLEQETEMVASIASAAFVEGNKWRLSDGERSFWAAIEDPGFLDRIDAGEPFRKGDMLRCRMRVEQNRTEEVSALPTRSSAFSSTSPLRLQFSHPSGSAGAKKATAKAIRAS